MNSRSLWSRIARSALMFCACAAAGASLTLASETASFAASSAKGAASAASAPSWPNLNSELPKGGSKNMSARDAALVVGIEDYAFVGDIHGARQNAEDWWSYFRKSRGIPRDGARILRDKEGTREKILREAHEVASKINEGGTLWFVFIGHGVASSDGEEGMLVGADAQGEADSLDARSIRQSELENIFRNSKAAKIMMVMDSCFSGRTPDGKSLAPGLQALVRKSQAQADSRVIRMSAGRSDQFAGPLPGGDRPAFSYLVLGALIGWGDTNHDGTVTAGEAVDYAADVLDSLVRSRRQTPELIAADSDKALPLASGATAHGPDIDRMVLSMFNNNNSNDADSASAAHNPSEASAAPAPMPPVPPAAPAPSVPPPLPAGQPVRSIIPTVIIPAGTYTPAENTLRHDYTPRPIDGFRIARTPVTVNQYNECVQDKVCKAPNYFVRCSFYQKDPGNLPMDCLEYEDAENFCRWAGGRLPTESEWEYAATHDGKRQRRTAYPWGNKRPYIARRSDVIKTKHKFANFSVYGDESQGTTPVGSFPNGASPLGLLDLSGNVMELVSPALTGEKYIYKGGNYMSPGRLECLEVGDTMPASTPKGGYLTSGVRCVWDNGAAPTQASQAALLRQSGLQQTPQPPAPPPVSPKQARNAVTSSLKFIHIPSGEYAGPIPGSRPTRIHSFGMTKHPITVGDFQQCVRAGVCSAEHFDQYDKPDGHRAFCNLGRGDAWDNHPMNCVNQQGAKEFCRWIGGRLPQEDEWRYAAGHDGKQFVQSDYPWGRDRKAQLCQKANVSNGNPKKLQFCFGKTVIPAVRKDRRSPLRPPANGGTSAVGIYSPAWDSPLGLTDLTGNVDEWTDSPGIRHICGQGNVPCYPLKGGSWNMELTTLDDKIRGGTRLNLMPMDYKGPEVGFRCVRKE